MSDKLIINVAKTGLTVAGTIVAALVPGIALPVAIKAGAALTGLGLDVYSKVRSTRARITFLGVLGKDPGSLDLEDPTRLKYLLDTALDCIDMAAYPWLLALVTKGGLGVTTRDFRRLAQVFSGASAVELDALRKLLKVAKQYIGDPITLDHALKMGSGVPHTPALDFLQGKVFRIKGVSIRLDPDPPAAPHLALALHVEGLKQPHCIMRVKGKLHTEGLLEIISAMEDTGFVDPDLVGGYNLTPIRYRYLLELAESVERYLNTTTEPTEG